MPKAPINRIQNGTIHPTVKITFAMRRRVQSAATVVAADLGRGSAADGIEERRQLGLQGTLFARQLELAIAASVVMPDRSGSTVPIRMFAEYPPDTPANAAASPAIGLRPTEWKTTAASGISTT